jgi:hypothetical protein
MLGTIVTTWRLSQAAVVVQDLLSQYSALTEVQGVESEVANKLVQKAHDDQPLLFQGKLGKRPHKVSMAATALGLGVTRMAHRPESQRVFTLALGSLLLEVTGKLGAYALSSHDHSLLELAQGAYLRSIEGQNETDGSLLQSGTASHTKA